MKSEILFVEILMVYYIHGIVLHSSADVAKELLLLQQEVAAIKQDHITIKQENVQLKASLKGKPLMQIRRLRIWLVLIRWWTLMHVYSPKIWDSRFW